MRKRCSSWGCICVGLYMFKGTNLIASALLCEGESGCMRTGQEWEGDDFIHFFFVVSVPSENQLR